MLFDWEIVSVYDVSRSDFMSRIHQMICHIYLVKVVTESRVRVHYKNY
jgi:hypothetical protein